MVKMLPREPWTETKDDLEARLRTTVAYTNAKYNVDCREMPTRMHDLVHKADGGDLRWQLYFWSVIRFQ